MMVNVQNIKNCIYFKNLNKIQFHQANDKYTKLYYLLFRIFLSWNSEELVH
jgi:hypothetical protein